jgi:hypothetical protein
MLNGGSADPFQGLVQGRKPLSNQIGCQDTGQRRHGAEAHAVSRRFDVIQSVKISEADETGGPF